MSKVFFQRYDRYHLIRTIILIFLIFFFLLIFILIIPDFFSRVFLFLFAIFFVLYHYFLFPRKIILDDNVLYFVKIPSKRLLRDNIISVKQANSSILKSLSRERNQIGLPNIFGFYGMYNCGNKKYFVYSSSLRGKDNIIIEYGLDSYLISLSNSGELLRDIDYFDNK